MKKVLLLLSCLLALLVGVSVAARHAYLFPAYGSALNFLSPPRDLWIPLASEQVQKGVRKYEFIVSHKYPGNHEVQISIPRQKGLDPLPGDLRVTLEIGAEGEIPIKRSGSGACFWGIKRQGASFCSYSFPRDIASRGNAICRVLIEGDIDSLLKRYGNVMVEITKGSDE